MTLMMYAGLTLACPGISNPCHRLVSCPPVSSLCGLQSAQAPLHNSGHRHALLLWPRQMGNSVVVAAENGL